MPRHYSKYQYGSGNGFDYLSKVTKLMGLTDEVFPDEKHVKGYNYLGPNTQLEMREKAGKQYTTPINKLDAVAKVHDYQYKDANDKLKKTGDKKAFEQEINDSDTQFIEEVSKIDGMTAKLAKQAILLKKWAEQAGLLNYKEFSQSGLGMPKHFKPNHYLKKAKTMNVQKGGFLPAIMPFLIPVLSSLTVELADKLITHLTKQKGSGMNEQSLDKKIEFIINKFDDMTPNKQVKTLSSFIIKN